MSNLVEWFNKEVLRWRTGAAAAWSLIMAMQFAFFFMIVATYSIFDPYSSLMLCLVRITTTEFWLISTVIGLSVLILIRLNVSHFRVTCDIPVSWLRCVWNHIRPSRLLFIVGYSVSFGIATSYATKLIGGQYKDWSYPCPQQETIYCLNEIWLFIAVNGCLYGMISAVMVFTSGSHILRFPAVSQRKLFEVKGQLFSLLIASAKRALKSLKYYCLLYYLGLGIVVQKFVLYHMDLELDGDAVRLSTLRGLLNVSLLFYTWLTATFVDFLFSVPHLLFTVYYTEPYVFPVESTYELLNGKCLHDAIACDSHALLQYLACLDLCRLSKFSAVRRQQVFSLTCLGGQPTNWINIRTACLAQLGHFIDVLASYGSTMHADVLGTSYMGAAAMQAPGASRTAVGGGPTSVPGLTSYSDLSSSAGDRLYTNLATPGSAGGGLGHRHISAGLSTSLPVQQPTQGQDSGFFSRVLWKLLMKVHQQRLVAYFVQETPATASRRLFADAQKYIFLVDGLSHLVCASFTEDVYGVVQSSLSIILSTLLNMLDAVDRHQKLCPVSLRRPRLLAVSGASREQFDVVLRFALKASIKSAIYRIVTTFHQHLNSVELSTENRRRLRLFEELTE